MFNRGPSTAQQLIEAQAEIASLTTQNKLLTDTLVMMEKRMDERAALISIGRNGRKIQFGFYRKKRLHYIETVGTWGDDVDGWKRDLLGE